MVNHAIQNKVINAKKERSGMNCKIQRLIVHPAYVLSVILVIQPMNGVLIAHGQVALGLVLIACQIPWAIRIAFKMHNAQS
jgi:hypothetical protein